MSGACLRCGAPTPPVAVFCADECARGYDASPATKAERDWARRIAGESDDRPSVRDWAAYWSARADVAEAEADAVRARLDVARAEARAEMLAIRVRPELTEYHLREANEASVRADGYAKTERFYRKLAAQYRSWVAQDLAACECGADLGDAHACTVLPGCDGEKMMPLEVCS